ncbi:hypothetical protein BGW36DRAFT_388321 [Talaromyces proteolyticus]|uniref:Gelsolin-like domain-containing protein n=1 Tax=Talaromyces proteolyticus TaxID=1131652 RepID=A0AAD4KKP2_9EURO|nr:uncharacterized protein BGW36DRAFT_388321 [Talaromyces proteolyticus]KAH8691441.1 hypothetical protein BGW36DRAFT_388321 [Talaromyces proteolyticus]
MPPHEGLVHLKEYDIKDSNVELIGSDIDHKVKYNSAATEPAWNDGQIGTQAGLHIWRIENFHVVPLPKNQYGQFYDGDSYIVLYSYTVKDNDGGAADKLGHEIFFWLGSKTSQDEAGTAAYKTVELDEFLHGAATQHREVQQYPSEEFVALFPRLSIKSGGVASGFRHVEEETPKEITTLLRIFKHPAAGRAGSLIVHEVEPTWRSLDDNDVFVLDKGEKIWVWQGNKSSPMEKAKAAQVVHDLTLAKHIDVEVLSQAEARSKIVVDLLGGRDVDQLSFQSARPLQATGHGDSKSDVSSRPKRLLRISDASGQVLFELVKEGQSIRPSDLDGKDIFVFDTGKKIWVWEGSHATRSEKASWIQFTQAYVRYIQDSDANPNAAVTPVAKVVQGHENSAFFKAIAL